MKYSYNWLKWYIPDAPSAEKLADIITYHVAEVESVEKREDGDSVFDIKILPNRAHDLLSHQGVARELASLLNISYVDPTPKYKIPESEPTKLEVEINTDKCRRDAARIVRNIKVGPSPDWVVKHLESIGQRSINNMVDVTNIIMFDCGQPSHVFDMDKVKGSKLDISASAGDEKITFLGGIEKNFEKDMVVIYDGEKNPIGTGVKGGTLAELDDGTKNIILQIDNFGPVSVRRMGQKLNVFTEGRKRFENDLSPELIPYAMRELSALILEMCPDAIFEDIVDVYPKKQEEQKLSFRVDKISKILGLVVSAKEIKDILKRYNFQYTEKDGKFEIAVPPMRLDLVVEEDMAEEIGRVLGYDKVKGNMPKIDFKPKVNEEHQKIERTRQYLLSQGFSEIMTYTFHEKGQIEVVASASDKKFLRESLRGLDKDFLVGGFEYAVGLNSTLLPLLGIKNYFELKVFEIGKVWCPNEEMHVVYFDGTSKNMEAKESILNDFYKTIPSNFSPEPRSYNLETKFKMWSLFPFIARDIAVWVPARIESSKVQKIIKENASELLIKGPDLFDEFKKNGQISYAFRLVFQSFNRTLTDTEVNEIMTKIINKIKENNAWQVR